MLTDAAQELVLGHLLSSRIKQDDAPAAAESHFCAAICLLVETMKEREWDTERAELIEYARQIAGRSS